MYCAPGFIRAHNQNTTMSNLRIDKRGRGVKGERIITLERGDVPSGNDKQNYRRKPAVNLLTDP